MKNLFVLIFGALFVIFNLQLTFAKEGGTVKGAVIGGLAGAAVGHPKAGAAAGAVVGHHKRKKAEKREAQAQNQNQAKQDIPAS